MLSFLFPRLTSAPHSGAALFDAITAKTRERHWYVAGEVPDTLDGRFGVLATMAALVIVRLEREGKKGDVVSVTLTERFIEVMESEHRELGLGDPKLGRTVRRLVGSLARRVELWRSAVASRSGWNDAARQSVYTGDAARDPLTHTAGALRAIWTELQGVNVDALSEGRMH